MAVCWKLWGRFICFENCFRKCIILVYKDCPYDPYDPYDPFELVILGWCHEMEQTNKWNDESNGSLHFCAMIEEIHSSWQKFTYISFGMAHAIPTGIRFVLTKWHQRVASTWNCSMFPKQHSWVSLLFQHCFSKVERDQHLWLLHSSA